jgi:hypothetical protein
MNGYPRMVIATYSDTCQHMRNASDERMQMSSAGPANGLSGAIGRVHMVGSRSGPYRFVLPGPR